jgi:hypothetical protein
MKTKIILLAATLVANFASAQDWERAGAGGSGVQQLDVMKSMLLPQRPAEISDKTRNSPVGGVWQRVVNGQKIDFHKPPAYSINGQVTAERDGLVILSGVEGEFALTNYSGHITDGEKVFALAMRSGKYTYGDTPMDIWDCGTPYIPSPEEIVASNAVVQAKAEIARQRIAQAQTNAVIWLKSQATNGSASAQCSLGEHYLAGLGCETNRAQAIYWFTQAANQGDIEASNKLAGLK